MPNNNQQWSSATPGLLIILLDQSGSMLSNYDCGTTRTKFASTAVNKVIDNIIQKNFDGDAPKNRCFISVIGYNQDVKELCSGWLKDLDANPLRYETLKKKTPDGAGGIVEMEVNQPVWVDPIDKDGTTNMLGAFQLAKDLSHSSRGEPFGHLQPLCFYRMGIQGRRLLLHDSTRLRIQQAIVYHAQQDTLGTF